MLTIHTLGTAAIDVGGTRIGPSSARLFAALLYLAAERGREVPRATLQELLFPDATARNGSHSVRQLLYSARRAGAPLIARKDAVVLRADLVSFDHGQLTAEDVEESLLSAATAGLLVGFDPTFSPAMQAWLDEYRSRLAVQLRGEVLRQASAARESCRWPLVASSARACLTFDPLNEEAHLLLAEALAMTGSKREAVRLLDNYEAEIGSDQRLMLPVNRLRRRISEHLPEPEFGSVGELPFVGRVEELRQLAEEYRRMVREGRPRLVLLHGEPGIGKTRLASEFTKRMILDGAVHVGAKCHPYDEQRPLGVFAQIVPILREMPGALGCSPESLQILDRLTTRSDPATTRLLNADPDALYAEIRGAILDLVESVGVETLLLITVQDTQWADASSMRIVRSIMSVSGRTLVVLTSRSSSLFDDSTEVLRVGVPPLSRAEAGTVISSVMSGLGSQAGNWMLQTAAGNPLFLSLLLAHYRSTGGSQSTPPSLLDLLRARVNCLTPDARIVLEACVILGRHARADDLEKLAGLERYRLLQALHTLEAAGLLRSDGAFARCGHDLVADTVQRMTPGTAALVLRRAAAELLEARSRDTADAELAADAAEHWIAAKLPRRAVDLLRIFADHTIQVGRPSDATAVLSRAMALCDNEDAAAEIGAQLITCAAAACHYEVALETAERLRRFTSPRSIAIASAPELRLTILAAGHVAALTEDTFPQEAEAIATDHRVEPIVRLGAALQLISYADDQLLPQVASGACSAVSDIDEIGDETGQVRVVVRCAYHACFGDLKLASRECLRAAEILGPVVPGRRVAEATRLGFLLVRAGEWERGTYLLEQAVETARRMRMSAREARALSFLAFLGFEFGDPSRAQEWHQEAIKALKAGEVLSTPLHLSNNIEAALRRGDAEDARQAMAMGRSRTRLTATRFAIATMTYEQRIRQLEGRQLTVAELEDLSQAHRRARANGLHDDTMHALWNELRAHGRSREARDLLEDYVLRYRREPLPLNHALRSACRYEEIQDRSAAPEC